MAAAVAALAGTRRPVLAGIAGSVAAGKSTTAGILSRLLGDAGRTVRILSTDGFLLPNEALAARGLLMEKGFPASYDHDLAARVLDDLRAGRPARVPVYSHDTYDRVPGASDLIEPADVVLVEGVNALQPPIVERLDVSLYLHADEAHIRDWFTARFLELCREAEAGRAPFYRLFVDLSPDERRVTAAQVWDGINGRNLREHIAPTRARATFVLTKAADHSVLALERQGGDVSRSG